MRAVFLVLGLAMASGAVCAQDISQQALTKCKGVSEVAEQIMRQRQSGVKMSDLMDKVSQGREVNPILAGMVTGAYQKSAFSTDEYRDKAASEYRDKYYTACIGMLNK
ncbi:MAG TPA: hypothetical protein DCP19_00675 [Pseudomonas sp.]|nr:hypothetical protein [Pseudomonas sp.]